MSCVNLTFEVWIRVKVTAHRLNEDNICNKLDGHPSMHMWAIARTQACVLWPLNVSCELDLWGINEDNICTKLDGHPSMHMWAIARTQACVLWPLNVPCDLDLWGMDPGQMYKCNYDNMLFTGSNLNQMVK